MTFLAPLLLAGLAALAIPILLHLLRRRETRTLDFPALRYLTRTTREQARIIRIRQILLLALRLAAILLLVFAAARLILPVGGRDHPPAGLALVVDNGLGSGQIVGTGRVLDSLVARAEAALEQAGSQDRIWIVEAGAPWMPAAPLALDQARARLRTIRPTQVRSDLPAALDRAVALLQAGAPPVREVVLVSDLRTLDVDRPAPLRPDDDPPIRVAPPPGGRAGNRGIEEALLGGGLTPRAGDGVDLFVRVRGAGPNSAVRAYVGDALAATGRTGLDGIAQLTLPPFEAGWVQGRVELDPDDLRGDDALYFAFRAVPPPGVARAGPLPGFLDDALSVLDDAGRIRLDAGGAIALRIHAGEGTPPPADAIPLLLVPPADPARLAALNLLLDRAAPGWRIEAPAEGEPVEREVQSGTLVETLPDRPRVRRTYRLEAAPGAAPATALLRLSDGSDWLVRVAGAAGPVYVLASPLTLDASDLPASPAMVPLLDLLASLAGGVREPGATTAGAPIPLPEGTASVRLPDGTVRPVAVRPALAETGSTGVYAFLDGAGDRLGLVAVNALPLEDRPTPTPGEAAPALGLVPEATAEAAEDWPRSVLQDRRGREVWRPLVASLLLVLLAEGWLAGLGGRRPLRSRTDG